METCKKEEVWDMEATEKWKKAQKQAQSTRKRAAFRDRAKWLIKTGIYVVKKGKSKRLQGY